jgi:hypothetical protein
MEYNLITTWLPNTACSLILSNLEGKRRMEVVNRRLRRSR